MPILACHDEVVVGCDPGQVANLRIWLKKVTIEGMDTVLSGTDEVVAPVEVEAWIARS